MVRQESNAMHAINDTRRIKEDTVFTISATKGGLI